MRTHRVVAFWTAAALVLLAGAPAGATEPSRPQLGRPVYVAALDAPLRLAGAGNAWRVAYRSTSWRGSPTVATGTVTVPSGRPPAGGWPVASFGHGFSGTADACAASRTGPSPWERAVQEALIAAGYAVVVADYEGIGTPAESPIVDGRAEAYGLIDVVRAARWLAPVSRSWTAVGYSLGGHAALFAAWLAPTYAPELRHLGTIAMAPITQWAAQLASPFVRDPVAPANPTLPYSGRSLSLTAGGAFRAADYFTAAGLALVDLAGTVCIEQMATRMAGLTNADVFLDPAAAAGGFQTLMADEEIPIGRYATPIRLVHGDADTLPAALTEITAGQLADAGSDVRYSVVPGADHFTLLPAIAADVVRWIDEFNTPASDFTVFAFSQSDVKDEDPQVYQLDPDINIRAIGKWSTSGDEASDYNFAQIGRYHDKGIAFMGSGTASVIFPQDFPSTAIFDDMATRDADNNPVPHEEIGVPGPPYRGNVFNPAYRQYVLSWAKIQVDGGADGINFDEVNGGFSGGLKYGFNGNEGFDDYALADFNQYLLAKYPAFTAADWESRFGMTDDNILRNDVPPSDLVHNFNYRTYLRANGWNTAPLTDANPLAGEWGRVTANRMYAEDTSFTATYLRRFWKEMVDELRAYAWNTARRRILVTSNGLLPYVDFNSVGMYPYNPDEQTPDFRGVDYVPVVDGHLNGAKSLQANYRYLKEKSRQIAGDVPVVVFIDWPNDMMTDYLNLPLAEKKDYWQIFGAEAYANGIFPAFHLKDTVGSPTAEQYGMLDFLQTYSQFYKDHRSLFRDNNYGAEAVRVGAANVSASLLEQRGSGARTLHLVNHNYDHGIVPQAGFGVEVDLPSCPRRVTMVSPDFAGSKAPASSCRHGKLRLTIDRLDYYDVLELR